MWSKALQSVFFVAERRWRGGSLKLPLTVLPHYPVSTIAHMISPSNTTCSRSCLCQSCGSRRKFQPSLQLHCSWKIKNITTVLDVYIVNFTLVKKPLVVNFSLVVNWHSASPNRFIKIDVFMNKFQHRITNTESLSFNPIWFFQMFYPIFVLISTKTAFNSKLFLIILIGIVCLEPNKKLCLSRWKQIVTHNIFPCRLPPPVPQKSNANLL